MLGNKSRVGTFNVDKTLHQKGMIVAGPREEIEACMEEKQIAITMLQETANKQNTRETIQ